jgi:tetratricopeptide (TPR) repeat protein
MQDSWPLRGSRPIACRCQAVRLHAIGDRGAVYASITMSLMRVRPLPLRAWDPLGRREGPWSHGWSETMSKPPLYSSGRRRPNSGHPALERAMLALRMQRPEEAEQLASGVLKSERGNVLAGQILGRALMMQNRAAEAIAPLERTARRSNDSATETLLATALAATGRRDEALEQLRKTTARRPPFALAFLEHGGLLSKMGRLDEAAVVLESGLALAPAAAADLRLELGFVHLKRNRRAGARALFLQVLAAMPERHDALLALAKVMALDGEYAGAADRYRRALAVRPDDIVTRNNLGICLLEIGERDAGEASLRVATRGSARIAGPAITALAAASHGRFFLRPSAVAKFLRVE